MSCSSKKSNKLPLAVRAAVLVWLAASIFFWCLYGYVFATIFIDIDGHPRDVPPDAGCYEYRKDNALEDANYYIFANWLSQDGQGDFDHDAVTDFVDYAILAEWWETNDSR